MSYYDRGWAPYVPVAERRRRAVHAMGKLAKKGHPVAPVVITGRAIVATFWGKAWCDNLESYHDFENRLARGRTYVRNGSVLDLQIAPREVTAMVCGSSLYRVTVGIDPVPRAQWRSICTDCAGGIDSLHPMQCRAMDHEPVTPRFVHTNPIHADATTVPRTKRK
jgi:hypothetical protein